MGRNTLQIRCTYVQVSLPVFLSLPPTIQPYPEDPAVYKPLSQEEIQRIKNEKKQKQNEKKQKVTENRKHLASVRVVQRNLVFVVGLSQRLADPEVSRDTCAHTHRVRVVQRNLVFDSTI